jgi:hypothetical protein
MLISKTRTDDIELSERLSNAFHFVLVVFFGLLTSDLALHIAAKLI